MLETHEPINVWVFFKGNQIQPFVFFWKGRRLKVDSINLVHSTRDGFNTYHHFSITSSGNYYRLRFDLKKLKWYLEEVEEDL